MGEAEEEEGMNTAVQSELESVFGALAACRANLGRRKVRQSPSDIAEREEQHYTPEALAERWGLSADTIRRLFQNEPGVLIVEHTRSHGRRRYRTMRIPESVAQRVHRRLSNVNLHT
jgi:AraC-like DNA-binding protein